MIDSVPPVILLDMLKKEKQRRLCEDSLYEFVKSGWATVEPSVEFVEGEHIRIVCRHLEAVTRGDIKRLLINFPPRLSKSLIVSVFWPVWIWIKFPSTQFMTASYSSTLSIRDALKSRQLIESPFFKENWGDIVKLSDDQNLKSYYQNTANGTRIATSVNSGVTGSGANYLILDDPHAALEAQSDALRETALDWFKTVWSSRLNNAKKDKMVVIMQRLHENDVSGYILNELKDWESVVLPITYDGVCRKTSLGEYDKRTEPGQLLCEERFGEAEIEKIKQLLGAYGYSGQYMQDPTPTGGGILKTQYFQLWPYDEGLPQFEFILQSYDSAFTIKNTGDPTACTVWGVFTFENCRQLMLIDAWDEHLAYPDLRKRVLHDWRVEYGGASKKSPYIRPKRPDRILVEAKASGQSLLQDLRLANVPAADYNPGNADKISRAHQAAPTLELEIIWIPESRKTPGYPVTWASEFMKQLTKFPVCAHDDYVDTFTQAVIYLKNSGLLELPRAKDLEEEPRKKRNTENPYAA